MGPKIVKLQKQIVVSQISEKFMDVLRYQCTFLLFLIFLSIIRINIRLAGNKKTEIFNFFSNLPDNNISWSVNHSIIKNRPKNAYVPFKSAGQAIFGSNM